MAGLTLQHPIPGNDGKPITDLTFRRLKAKDMRRMALAANNEERGLVMLSCATDLPMDVIDEIDIDDVTNATEALADFLAETPSGAAK